tara:strand:+ start:47573 stop:47995 length:423 start_codon:yes stop_codon:yes gene_type:complete
MGDDRIDNNGYSDDEFGNQVLELCKLAQGNVTTIYWCKQQIKKRLKILDRLADRRSEIKGSGEKLDHDRSRIEGAIKKQTDACKELGDKIQLEVESLDAIRLAAKSYGIDIKSRLLELDGSLADEDGFDEFFPDDGSVDE